MPSLISALVLVLSAAKNIDWVTHTDPGGRFAIEFPIAPTDSVLKVNSDFGPVQLNFLNINSEVMEPDDGGD